MCTLGQGFLEIASGVGLNWSASTNFLVDVVGWVAIVCGFVRGGLPHVKADSFLVSHP